MKNINKETNSKFQRVLATIYYVRGLGIYNNIEKSGAHTEKHLQ